METSSQLKSIYMFLVKRNERRWQLLNEHGGNLKKSHMILTQRERGHSPQRCDPLILLAGRPGFEPGLTESESAVLPLDDLPVCFAIFYPKTL